VPTFVEFHYGDSHSGQFSERCQYVTPSLAIAPHTIDDVTAEHQQDFEQATTGVKLLAACSSWAGGAWSEAHDPFE